MVGVLGFSLKKGVITPKEKQTRMGVFVCVWVGVSRRRGLAALVPLQEEQPSTNLHHLRQLPRLREKIRRAIDPVGIGCGRPPAIG